MSEVLNYSDHVLAQKAHQDLIKANSVWEFAHAHLVATYQIQPGDSVDIATGAITRGQHEEKPEPPKVEKKTRVKKPAAEVTD